MRYFMLTTGPGAPASLEFRGHSGGGSYLFKPGRVISVRHPRDGQILSVSDHVTKGRIVEVTKDGQPLRFLPHRGKGGSGEKGPASFMKLGSNRPEMPPELKEELEAEQADQRSSTIRDVVRREAKQRHEESNEPKSVGAFSKLTAAIKSKKSKDPLEGVREVPSPSKDLKSDTSRVKKKSGRNRSRHED